MFWSDIIVYEIKYVYYQIRKIDEFITVVIFSSETKI